MLPVNDPHHPELLTILQAIDELVAKAPVRDQPLISSALSAKARDLVSSYPARLAAMRKTASK